MLLRRARVGLPSLLTYNDIDTSINLTKAHSGSSPACIGQERYVFFFLSPILLHERQFHTVVLQRCIHTPSPSFIHTLGCNHWIHLLTLPTLTPEYSVQIILASLHPFPIIRLVPRAHHLPTRGSGCAKCLAHGLEEQALLASASHIRLAHGHALRSDLAAVCSLDDDELRGQRCVVFPRMRPLGSMMPRWVHLLCAATCVRSDGLVVELAVEGGVQPMHDGACMPTHQVVAPGAKRNDCLSVHPLIHPDFPLYLKQPQSTPLVGQISTIKSPLEFSGEAQSNCLPAEPA
jgi:hypothetical protein